MFFSGFFLDQATQPEPHHHLLEDDQLTENLNETTTVAKETGTSTKGQLLNISAIIDPSPPDLPKQETSSHQQQQPASYKKLLYSANYHTWKRLPYTHWPMLFGLYNMSLYGQYISILPPIQLSMTISPESAKQLRHSEEEQAVR